MWVVLRKVRTALVVAAVVIVGGGFASAEESDSHNVTYTILSFRAVSLSSNADVPFDYVRQGQKVTVPGPTLLYATTFASDLIEVALDADTLYGVVLSVSAGSPTPPSASPSAPASIGGPACDGALSSSEGNAYQDVPLSSSTPQPLIDGIADCGIDQTGYWVEAPLSFTVDASTTDGDPALMTQGLVTSLVTYTIKAAA